MATAAPPKPKVGTKTVDANRREKRQPVEDRLQTAGILQLGVEGRDIGVEILRKGNEQFRFVFFFQCQGIHNNLRPEQIEPTFDALANGLKDLPAGERLTVHFSSFTDPRDRLAELEEVRNQAEAKEFRFFLKGQQERCKQLARNGTRQTQSLWLYATYTVDLGGQSISSWLERAVYEIAKRWQNFWHSLAGTAEEREQAEFARLFRSVYFDGFCTWERLLTDKLGLSVTPATPEGAWQQIWRRFNTGKPRPIPYLIRFDGQTIREEFGSDLHPASVLLHDRPPQPSRKCVYFPDAQDFVGVLPFADKPEGWANKSDQLSYPWRCVTENYARDVEVFTEITPAPRRTLMTQFQRNLKQSKVQAGKAQESQNIDKAAEVRTDESAQVQEKLYRGATPVYCATTFLFHRNNKADLHTACNQFTQSFNTPAWVPREEEYPWKIWLDTLTSTWDPLLYKPFDRRLTYLNDEVVGKLPLMRPNSQDSSGFELISAQGGAPIHLNFYPEHRNCLFFGTTRSGKSVLVGGILTEFLARGLPVVALDYPNPEGKSTFSDYTAFLDSGAYFDIGNSANNLFERPRLEHLDEQQRAENLADYKDFVVSALVTMVLGASPNESSMAEQLVRPIVTIALGQFFRDEAIEERYVRAEASAPGQPDWENVTTLHDFVGFCTREALATEQLSANSESIDEALQLIQLRLNFWLNSRVGQAISQPSSFDANASQAQLLVFALRNLSSDEDAAVLSLSAYSAALRRALSSPASLFFIDEAPILFEFEQIAQLVSTRTLRFRPTPPTGLSPTRSSGIPPGCWMTGGACSNADTTPTCFNSG